MVYLTILAIEDDAGRMRLYHQLLPIVSPGTQLTGVDNVSNALKAIRETRYDFYICDCDFPLVSHGENPQREIIRGAFFDYIYTELIQLHPSANIEVCSHLEKNLERARGLGLSAHLKGKISIRDLLVK